MRSARIFASARSRRVALAALVALLAVFLGSLFVLDQYAAWLTDPFVVRERIRSYGPLAPLAFMALQTAQVILAPIPGQVLGLASGFLFGALWGTVYSIVGATVGTYVAFTLARRLGRPYVEELVTDDALTTFDSFTDNEGPLALFLIFLVPGLPDDVICFLAGLTDMDIPKMVAISVVGRLPGYLAVNAAGAGLASRRTLEAVTLLVALAVLSAVAYRYRERLFESILEFDQR
ncbi:TVP38/TMEM64 family protein [Salinibaculum rarum]|uniref:TVP38/TMEM64 family protein n=1 Tax=Salinibaculum rarum TaxID=3058903 RepID=UPI00265E304B|nr:TVP38/TMEM64 family protein [Salinibaculum sp. KK48]